MSTIDLQKFMEMRETARVRQQEQPTRKAAAAKSDIPAWQKLLESKRQEIGLPASPRSVPTRSTVTPVASSTASVRTTAADLTGALEDKIEVLRDRKSQGLAVRELGNFIDVRA